MAEPERIPDQPDSIQSAIADEHDTEGGMLRRRDGGHYEPAFPEDHLIAISPAGGQLTVAVNPEWLRRIARQLEVVGEARYTAWNPYTCEPSTVVFKPREAL